MNTATAAPMMPMIAITTTSSIRVTPRTRKGFTMVGSGQRIGGIAGAITVQRYSRACRSGDGDGDAQAGIGRHQVRAVGEAVLHNRHRYLVSSHPRDRR